ncbi:MAG: alpha/beta hydrolase [Sphingobacteriales bacterium]|nr:alpha/beta hydrolase [Sphingobacteriales bacterium]
MKRGLLVLIVMVHTSCVFAQYVINIVLNVPATRQETIFIAGNFNGWNPSAEGFQLQQNNTGKYFLQIKNQAAGNYEFKFTRGSWNKVECSKSGGDVGNHSVQLFSDTTVEYTIEGWKDDFTSAATKHSASSHVKIIDTAFAIPQLNRTRRIWVYLPEGYEQSKKHYPVLYLQDGQNVFDAATSFAGEWGVDEIMDSLIKIGDRECIVVAIDNGGEKRMNEYLPYDFEAKENGITRQTLIAEGDAYLDFLVKNLKVYIDKNFRTAKAKETTYVAGSSMGGLISFYALMKYPDVFGGAGVFSPSFWIVPQINDSLQKVVSKINSKIFFYAGELEGETMVSDMNSIADAVGLHSYSIIYKIVDPEGKHNEPTWRKWFAEFYQWMMMDGYDGKIKTE